MVKNSPPLRNDLENAAKKFIVDEFRQISDMKHNEYR